MDTIHSSDSTLNRLGPDDTWIQRKRMEIQESKKNHNTIRPSNMWTTQDKEMARQQMQKDAYKRMEDLSQQAKNNIPSNRIQQRHDEYSKELLQRNPNTSTDRFIQDITCQVIKDKIQRQQER